MKARAWMFILTVLVLGAAALWIYLPEKRSRLSTGDGHLTNTVPAVTTPAPEVAPSIPAPAIPAPEAPVAPTVAPPPVALQVPSLSKVADPVTMTPGPAAPNAPSPPPPQSAPTPVDELEAAAIHHDQVGLMLRDYRTLMGENPFGTNAEIMKAIMGGNPRGARLGPPPGLSLNGQGELVDQWGTPYFFHQMSATNMEIRSAGPDRALWTPDDVTQP